MNLTELLIAGFGAPVVLLLFKIWNELHRANRLKETELTAAGVDLPDVAE